MKPELKPCPFCGGSPSISKHMDESLWSHDIVLWTGVSCDECEAQVGPTCEGFEVEAVDIWNRRAPAEPVKVPSDDELLEWAEQEQFFLFCDKDEFLDIARTLLAKYGTQK